MDGIHDLGGKAGFTELDPQGDTQPFPERWQGAVFTMVNTLMAHGITPNVDYFRHAVERIDPISYLTDGYYGRWLGAAETIAVEAGVVDQNQISERAAALGAPPAARVAARPDTTKYPGKTDAPVQPTALRSFARKPQFALDQIVRTVHTGVAGHTRLPAYARGCSGRVVAWHGAWVYPDSNAHGGGEQPQHLYTVVFSGQSLWGDTCDADLEVCLDLFEPYLEA